MKKFNLKEHIAKNKATFFSSLNEGEAAYEYEKGKSTGEKIEKTKMKKSELKAKIKEMIIAEMNGAAVVDSEYDFLKEIEEMLNEAEGLTPLQQYIYDYEQEISGDYFAGEELNNIKELNNLNDVYNYYANYRGWEKDKDFKYDLENLMKTLKKKFGMLNEADEETDVDVEAADDTTGEDTTAGEEIDVTTDEVDPNVKSVQDALTQAQAAAQQLGDKKLMDQIGNTITFFTRAHVVNKPKDAVSENEDINEGFYGNSELEELANILGYDSIDDFFQDNPGAVEVVLDWAQSIPEFMEKLRDNDLMENKKPNLNESMFPMLKKILK